VGLARAEVRRRVLRARVRWSCIVVVMNGVFDGSLSVWLECVVGVRDGCVDGVDDEEEEGRERGEEGFI
jgi:hypothetical protein